MPWYSNIFKYIFHHGELCPFLTGINSIKYRWQKDFSLNFETFDVILSNVANEGNWKLFRNLSYSWTVKIFSSKNATSGHTKSFFVVNAFLELDKINTTNLKECLLKFSNFISNSTGAFLYFFELLRIWYLTTWHTWLYRWWIFWDAFIHELLWYQHLKANVVDK